MAKRARAGKSDAHELNPGVKAAGTWHVVRAGTMGTLAINADYLDVTDSGALIFMLGGANSPPQIVVAADQYLYCTRVR
jgi:hypothetical protein